ncbi:PA1571 family protein [Alloalcanivorax sp. C16-1]|uniref:PA1571 family protein n=1 Tax=Alloalcanivorax sp. C16-1 TaxID=3390051 RepID=UPI0039709D37
MHRLNYSQGSSRREFNGAAVVDEQGREIPITDAMILRACKELEQAWHYPTPARKAG